MSDLYDQVVDSQDGFTKLVGKLPGFKGYFEKGKRRAADKLLRDKIADQYKELWKRVGNIQQDFASSGELEYLDDLEKAAMKIQTFIDKISGAAYGYAGFFDAIKVKEEELAKIYQFDLNLLDMADEVKRGIDNVETSVGTEGLPAAVRHLISLTRDLVSTFESRDEVITAVE